MSDRAHIVLAVIVGLAATGAAVALCFRLVVHPRVKSIMRDAIEVSAEANRPPPPRCPSCHEPVTDWPCDDPRHADGWGMRGWTWESPFYREYVTPERRTTYVDDVPIPPGPDPVCDRCDWPIAPGEHVVFMSLGSTPGDDPGLTIIEHGIWHADCPRKRGHLRLVA